MSTIVLVLQGEDELSGPLARGQAEIKGLGSAAQATGGHLGGLGRAAQGVGGALSHAGGQIRNLVTGPLGMLGLAGGLFTVAGALEKGIGKAQAWGLQIEKLQGITHDSAEQLSGLLAVTEKYGLSNERLSQIAGFTEKALGNLTKGVDDQGHAVKGAAEFVKTFGFNIYDAHGRVKDFESLLLTFSDYWKNGAQTPAEKAAAAAKLFGRGYADLVPILNLGARGIQDAEEQAKALGLTLTQDNVTALAQMREKTRQLGDAFGGLELQMGLALIPTINEFATTLTKFVSEHRGDIVSFVTGLASVAREVAGDVGHIVGGLASAWNAIPKPLRDLLLQGFVADRTIKWLFGFSPIHVVMDVAEKAISSALGATVGATIGKGIAGSLLGGIQKVFVVNPGFGGAAGAAEGGAEAVGAGLLTTLLGAAAITAIAAAAVYAAHEYISNHVVKPALDQEAANAKAALTAASSVAELQAQKAALQKGIADINGTGFGLGSIVNFGTVDALKTQLAAVQARLDAMSVTPSNTPSHYAGIGPGANGPLGGGNTPTHYAGIGPGLNGPLGYVDTHPYIEGVKDLDQSIGVLTAAFRDAPWLKKLEDSWRKAGQTMHDKIAEAIKGLSGPHAGSAAVFLGSHLGQAGFGAGGYKQAEEVLAVLRSMKQSPDVVAAITRLTAQLPRLKTDAADLARAEQVAQGSDPKNAKLDKLNAIMADLKAHGDRTTRAKVEDLITAVKHQKLHTTVNLGTGYTVEVTTGTGVSTKKGATSLVSRYSNVRYEYAAGGAYPAGRPRLVGEGAGGPELDIPDHSGFVLPAGPTAALARLLSGAGASPAGEPAVGPHLARLATLLERMERQPAVPRRPLAAPSYVTSRDVEYAHAAREALGPSRARQGALAGR